MFSSTWQTRARHAAHGNACSAAQGNACSAAQDNACSEAEDNACSEAPGIMHTAALTMCTAALLLAEYPTHSSSALVVSGTPQFSLPL